MSLDDVIEQLQRIVWHLEQPLSVPAWEALETDLQTCYRQLIDLASGQATLARSEQQPPVRAALPDLQKMCRAMRRREALESIALGRKAILKLEQPPILKQTTAW